MKLTNLSLAIMVAVGVAACGGSDDNNSNKPADPPKPSTPSQPQQPEQPKQPEAPSSQQTVDPTGTQVVDDKDLTKQNTVGTLQYIRRDGSQYDRTLNPSKPASASPLLGTTLNDQNPSLTNIVLARQEIVRADGTPVKAQFTGSDNPMPLKPTGEVIKDSVANLNSLQEENFNNVDLFAGLYKVGASNAAGTIKNVDGFHSDDGSSRPDNARSIGANNVDEKGKFKRDYVTNAKGVSASLAEIKNGERAYHYAYVKKVGDKYERIESLTGGNDGNIPVENNPLTTNNNLTGKTVTAAANNGVVQKDASNKYKVVSDARGVTAVIDPYAVVRELGNNTLTKVYSKDVKDGKDVYMYRGSTPTSETGSSKVRQTVTPEFAYGPKGGARYGKDLVWWTTPEHAFENNVSRGKTDTGELDFSGGDSKAATNGLVRIGGGLSTLGQELNYNKTEKKWEDHHNTTTRIFGRYHLAYAGTSDKNKGVHPVAFNSFSGAKTFVAEYESNSANAANLGTKNDEAGKATLYSIGAVPMTLKYVQYGRVSTQLDVDEGVKGYADNFIRNPYAKKNTDDSVDNYFYRGTNATTIEQMAALPSDQKATYRGHALMYGIENDYHNAGKRNLPNAFAGATSGLGLGNFVEARVDFGKKRVLGDVYNEWLLDPTKATTTRDNLVRFQGNIVGNTVVGTADRTYVAGDDCATFKASFFGEKAEEMGGSFNSVQDPQKYGDAYGQNDWGGVFGASKGDGGNTFQGDDGNNNYGNNNPTP